LTAGPITEPTLNALERRFRSAPAKALQLSLLAGLITALSIVLPVPLPARTIKTAGPRTTGREVAIRLDDLLPKGHRKDFKVGSDGTVKALRKETLDAAVTCPAMPFTAMAMVWEQHGKGPLSARVEVGQDAATKGMSAQLEAEPDGPDPGSPEDHPELRGSSLLWVGNAGCSRLTITLPAGAAVKNLRAVYVNSAGASAADAFDGSPTAGGSALGASVAEAATTEPAIITRKQWGANEKFRNCGPYYVAPVKMGFVHHTADGNTYSRSESDDMVRAILWYHTQALGWCDIAYNFLVDRFGRVFEGRYGGMDQPVLPGATKGFNTGSVAVSAIGTFSTATPPTAMVASIERLLAWRLDVAHVPPTGKVWMYSRGSTGGKYPEGQWVQFNRISGHRDAGFTACPGDRLYAKLGSIRTVAYNTGLPKIFLPKEKPDWEVEGQSVLVTWTASASEKLWWHIDLRDPQGHVLRSWKRWGLDLSLSKTVVDASGLPLSPGTYSVRIWGTRRSHVASAATMPFTVVSLPPPSPSPSPAPSPSDSPSPSPSP
jgi:hypothetical protein